MPALPLVACPALPPAELPLPAVPPPVVPLPPPAPEGPALFASFDSPLEQARNP
jgi:hypothetical protein